MTDLDGDESYPDFGEADDARAGMGLPSWTAGTRSQGGLVRWLAAGHILVTEPPETGGNGGK